MNLLRKKGEKKSRSCDFGYIYFGVLNGNDLKRDVVEKKCCHSPSSQTSQEDLDI